MNNYIQSIILKYIREKFLYSNLDHIDVETIRDPINQFKITLRQNGQSVSELYSIYNDDLFLDNTIENLMARLQQKLKDNSQNDVIKQLKELVGKL